MIALLVATLVAAVSILFGVGAGVGIDVENDFGRRFRVAVVLGVAAVLIAKFG